VYAVYAKGFLEFYEPLIKEESTLFFNLVAAKCEKSLIIMTTNKTFGQCDELIGDNAIATATLDRLLHHAEVIIMEGESYQIKKRSKLGPHLTKCLLKSKMGNNFSVIVGNNKSVLTILCRDT